MSPAHLSPTPSLRQVASILTPECCLNMSPEVTVTVSSAPGEAIFLFSLAEFLTKKTLPGGERAAPCRFQGHCAPREPREGGGEGSIPHPVSLMQSLLFFKSFMTVGGPDANLCIFYVNEGVCLC